MSASFASRRTALVCGLICFALAERSSPLMAGTAYTVNSAADTNTGVGSAGTLRYCLTQANATGGAGSTITFDSNYNIVLTSILPPIGSNLASITGFAGASVSGNNLYPVFFVNSSNPLTLSTLLIQNGNSTGGAGGTGQFGGGGAAGAGGGLLLQPGANVTVNNMAFNQCSSVGGAGGDGTANIITGGGGGGGIFGAAGGPGGVGNSSTGVGGGGGGGGGVGLLGTGGTGSYGGGGGGGFQNGGGSGDGSPGGGGGGGAGSSGAGVASSGVTGGTGGAGGSGDTAGAGGTQGHSGGSSSNTSGGLGSAGGGGGGGNGSPPTTIAGAGGAGGEGGGGGGAGGSTFNGGMGGNSSGSFGGGGGGGGAGGISATHVGGVGGQGSFGGGGGGGGAAATSPPPGNQSGTGGAGGYLAGGGAGGGNSGGGGFGGGGGGGSLKGNAGSFGGDGFTGGGGGGGLGGAIFVPANGVLTLGTGVSYTNNNVVAGAGGGGNNPGDKGDPGQTSGPDLFIQGGATLVCNPSDMLTFPQPIGGIKGSGGSLTMNGTGTLVLPPNSTYVLSNQFTSGTVQISDDTSLGGSSNTVALSGTAILAVTATTSTSRSITITGSPQISVASGDTYSINSPISGSGVLGIAQGTVLLNGANTYDGGTSIAVGATLQASTQTLPTTGNINPDNGTLVLLQSTSGTYAQNILGSGALITEVAPSATLTLGGVISLANWSLALAANQTSAGSVVINNSATFTNSPTMAAGTALGGDGSLSFSGTMLVNGTITPSAYGANLFSTLTLGACTFTSGSQLVIYLGGELTSDAITSSGVVEFESGSQIVLQPTSAFSSKFLPGETFTYTVVMADGGTIGSTPTVNSSFMPLQCAVSISDPPGQWIITVYANSFYSLTEQPIAGAFDDLAATNPPGYGTVLVALNSLTTISALEQAFNQMSAACASSLALAEENVAERVRALYTEHLLEQHRLTCPSEASHPWSLWVTPFGEKVQQRNGGQCSGYREWFWGVASGVDYRSHDFLVGGGFTYAHGHLNWGHQGTGNFNTYSGTLAGVWAPAHFSLDVAFSYAYNPGHGNRTIQIAALQSKEHYREIGNSYMSHLGFLYDFDFHRDDNLTWSLWPFLNIDYVYLHETAHTGSGAQALDLHVDSKGYDLFRPEVGLGASLLKCARTYELLLEVSASYARESRFMGKHTTAHFAAGSTDFTVSSFSPQNNLFCPTVRFLVSTPGSRFSAILGYHGDFGSNFTENEGELELKVAF